MRNSNLIEVAKISTLSCKIDNYEYLTGEEILPCNQKQIIEEAKYIYSTLGKAFEEQTKTIKDQGGKKLILKTRRSKTRRLNKINWRNFSKRSWK